MPKDSSKETRKDFQKVKRTARRLDLPKVKEI
jgi:hypothetical protein